MSAWYKHLLNGTNYESCSLLCIVKTSSLILSGTFFGKKANVVKTAFLTALCRSYSCRRQPAINPWFQNIQIYWFPQFKIRWEFSLPGELDDATAGQGTELKTSEIFRRTFGLPQPILVLPYRVTIGQIKKSKNAGKRRASDRSALAKKMKLKHDPNTKEISVRCTDFLFGKMIKFLPDGRKRARAVFSRRFGTCL